MSAPTLLWYGDNTRKKLAILFNHYGIADKKNWAALAYALAAEHVPGFRYQFPEAKSKRGRKRIWEPDRLMELDRTVQSIKQRGGLNDRQALTFMVNNKEHATVWGAPIGHKGSRRGRLGKGRSNRRRQKPGAPEG